MNTVSFGQRVRDHIKRNPHNTIEETQSWVATIAGGLWPGLDGLVNELFNAVTKQDPLNTIDDAANKSKRNLNAEIDRLTRQLDSLAAEWPSTRTLATQKAIDAHGAATSKKRKSIESQLSNLKSRVDDIDSTVSTAQTKYTMIGASNPEKTVSRIQNIERGVY